jgi:carbonic anhydrase
MADSGAALARLMDGNRRFLSGDTTAGQMSKTDRAALVRGQAPHAIVFGCVDSRVSPNEVFDAGPGDLLVIRTAGQVVDDAVMGSIEFGVLELSIPLILVLGHTHCGAVTAACHATGEEPLPGKLDVLVQAIQPAVQAARILSNNRDGTNLIDLAVAVNVRFAIDRLMSSPIIQEAVKAGNLRIVGAVYDLATGTVSEVDSDEG